MIRGPIRSRYNPYSVYRERIATVVCCGAAVNGRLLSRDFPEMAACSSNTSSVDDANHLENPVRYAFS